MGREVWQRGREELLRELRELESRMRRDYSAALELIAELELRDAAADSGYPSLTELLRDLLRITPREVKRRIGHARAVTEVPLVSGGAQPAPLPATGSAAREGVLGPDHVEAIARALTGLPLHVAPEAVADAERIMVAAAASMDARTLARVGARVRAVLDQDGTPPSDAELTSPLNELHFSTRSNGRMVLRGELAPEVSALFQALLSPLAKPRPSTAEGQDRRTPAERNGDALADILHLAAGRSTEGAGSAGMAGTVGLPVEGGERPHVLVTVSLQALRDGIGTVQLDRAGDLDAAAARRIACDCKLIPAVLGASSEPLDVGRASYAVPTGLRRALVLRDGGCAFPGCERPSGWCHSHHIRHWVDGGHTRLDNLVLLCGRHHRLLHHSEWQCAVVGGIPEFYPPRYIDPTGTARRNILHPRRQ